MRKSILHGVIGFRAYLHGSRLPLLDLNAPQTTEVHAEIDADTRELLSMTVERRWVLDGRTPWVDSDGEVTNRRA
jgi:hypothetical protein